MEQLINTISKAKTLVDASAVIGVYISNMPNKAEIHLSEIAFDGAKRGYSWETKRVPFGDGAQYDEEFTIVDGVRVFCLRELEKEAV